MRVAIRKRDLELERTISRMEAQEQAIQNRDRRGADPFYAKLLVILSINQA